MSPSEMNPNHPGPKPSQLPFYGFATVPSSLVFLSSTPNLAATVTPSSASLKAPSLANFRVAATSSGLSEPPQATVQRPWCLVLLKATLTCQPEPRHIPSEKPAPSGFSFSS